MEGDPRVDELMRPVRAAIERHIKDPDAKTDIYNRAYEALIESMNALDVSAKVTAKQIAENAKNLQRAESAEAQLQVVGAQLKTQMEQWKQDCKRAESAEAKVKEMDLLLREAIGGAAWESCEYKDYEIAIPTWHCCDWSEWVREVAEKLGIKLPQPPKPEGEK